LLITARFPSHQQGCFQFETRRGILELCGARVEDPTGQARSFERRVWLRAIAACGRLVRIHHRKAFSHGAMSVLSGFRGFHFFLQAVGRSPKISHKDRHFPSSGLKWLMI
jgi:hypothetical protein